LVSSFLFFFPPGAKKFLVELEIPEHLLKQCPFSIHCRVLFSVIHALIWAMLNHELKSC